MALLKAKQLIKSYFAPSKIEVLRGIDFEAEGGEAIAIMGKSGEGKSTLLQILGTLEEPCDGELWICDERATSRNSAPLRSRHLGFIFQAYNLLEDCTALQNVLMPARIARQNVKKDSPAWKRGLELLSLVGIEERAHFPAKVLSGGERQRVAIARALCNNPSLILADEPTGNLDYTTSQQIHELLLSSVKKLGKTLIIVTHDRELAALCDRILTLKDGLLA